MKKILFAVLLSLGTLSLFAANGPGVDEKILASFNKAFKNAEEVSWTEMSDSYQVSFKQNAISSKITYDKQGNILKTLRYYYEDQLPLMILSKVKTKFAGKKIHGVVEMSSEAGTIYHITLEDENSWTEVKADVYANLNVEKKFKKA